MRVWTNNPYPFFLSIRSPTLKERAYALLSEPMTHAKWVTK